MSCDYIALANAGIQALQPYQAGKPIEELERELGISNIVKLASNENPLGMSPKAREAILAACDKLALYPDANGFYLKQAIAEKFNVAANQITLGNGSNDLLELIARVFVSDKDEVIFSDHAFVVYPMVTQSIGAHAVSVPAKDWGHDLDAMLAAISDKTKLIFIANPNNPTGTHIAPDHIEAFLEKVPAHIIVVLDEAYNEYLSEQLRGNSAAYLSRFPNLLICRTFSKAYGLAGLRVGYCLSSELIANLLNRLRQPFNVNALALAAAQAALNDEAFLTKSVEVNRAGLIQLEAFFKAEGISYIPSTGNFISFCVPNESASFYYQGLLQHGVIVRPVEVYKMPGYLRVSIGTAQENQRFIDAMQALMG